MGTGLPYIFFITCVVRSTDFGTLGNIIAIGTAVSRWTAEEVERSTRFNTAIFYSEVNGIRARIVTRRQADGDLYFTTDPDGYLYNNLQSLPGC